VILDPNTVGRTPLTGDQPVARPLPIGTQNKLRHSCLEWDSNAQSQCSSELAKTVHALDHAAIAIDHVSITAKIVLLVLQPLGSWSLFQFLNPIHNRQDCLDGGSARRKAATYTQNNTNTE
jgi:hypothetical protein